MTESQLLEHHFDRLFPLDRSLTGNGVRQSLDILKTWIETLKTYEIPAQTSVFDWIVPHEWNVAHAHITTPDGNKICDFKQNNLHLLGYSTAYEGQLTLDQLKPHLHTLPTQPNAIPYITSYYKQRWGFCLTHDDYLKLPQKGLYTVSIDATHDPKGSLTYADAIIEGKTDQEILISTYICHPSMANNELSGILVASMLYQRLKTLPETPFYTYRFVFVPETIGSIVYLSKHGEHLKQKLEGGLVATCVGLNAPFTYKKSKQANANIDLVAAHILKHKAKDNHSVIDFFPQGSDERQYCSPGFNLPVGSLMRTMYWIYPEYHTSLDNKSIIDFEAMVQTVDMYQNICKAMELNQKYINLCPFGEPMLSKRNLMTDLSTKNKQDQHFKNMVWILSYSDGNCSLLDIAEKQNICILDYQDALRDLKNNQLIQ